MRGMPIIQGLVLITLALGGTMSFELQGHRGTRGLAPENTLMGFSRALEIGVDRLELDVGMTADGVLVAHHDTHINPDTTRLDGAWVEQTPSLRSLTWQELNAYDVGRLRPGTAYAKRFEELQGADGVRIPALAEVAGLGAPLNVETKLDPTRPEATASPEDFARALLALELDRSKVVVQSFDWRVFPHLGGAFETACLTEAATVVPGSAWTGGLDPASFDDLPSLVKAAGCDIWSPDHEQLSAELVTTAHALGLRVIPWTVNDTGRGAVLLQWGVDGLITDYPDRFTSFSSPGQMGATPGL